MRRQVLVALVVALSIPVLCGGTSAATETPADTMPPVTHSFAPDGDPSTIARFPGFYWQSEGQSPIASYDVRVSYTPMRASTPNEWTYPAALVGITTTSVRLYVRPGHIVCVQARARDTAGNVEPWRSHSYACSVRALDDSALKHSGHIEKVRNDRFANNGKARVLHYGARMWLNRVPKGSWVGVILTTLPNPDRVLTWRLPGIGRFSWGISPRVHHRVIVTLDNRTTHEGPVRIMQPYHYRSVPFEGITVIPRWVTNGGLS